MISFQKAVEASYRLYLSFNKIGLIVVANGKLANRLLLYKMRDETYKQGFEILSLGVIADSIDQILKVQNPELYISLYDKTNAFGSISHKLPVHLFALPKPLNLEQVIVGNAALLVTPQPVELTSIWKELPI